MELIVLSLVVGAFFILFFYISKVFKQQPAEAQNPTTGTDNGSHVCCESASFHTDPDATFILMPIRILPQVLHLLENRNFFYFCSLQCQFSLFLVCVIGGIIFNIVYSILKFAGKKNTVV
jgi:hypothetical protein